MPLADPLGVPSLTRRFELGQGPTSLTVYATLAMGPSGPSALLLNCSKPGSLERGMFRLLGITLTKLLQCGTPASDLASMLRHHDFGPGGPVKLGEGRGMIARSVADAMGAWMEEVLKDGTAKES